MRFRSGTFEQLDTQTVSIDLQGFNDDGVVGWRARRHAGLVDVSDVGGHAARDFWEPLYAEGGQLVLDPDEFYILASKEARLKLANFGPIMQASSTQVSASRRQGERALAPY